MTQVTIFSKPNCQYCARAKAVLKRAEIDYQEYDVTSSQRNADASVYFSGVVTVPQIFIGDYHINGAEDLEKLAAERRLPKLLEINTGNLLAIDTLSDEELHRGANDFTLREYILRSDGSRDTDEESLPILHFYKEFFGFWPNTFAYLHHWKKAYKLFVYCHNFSAVAYGQKFLSMKLMSAIGYSTSNAHGCSYCQVHSAATGGEQSLNVVEQLKQARQGKDTSFDESDLALTDLAAAASKNEVDKALRDRLQSLNVDQQSIEGTKMVTSAFGFLNVFNDLTGLEIEGDWARQAQEKSGIEAGRHGSEDTNPANLDYEIPKGNLSIQDMLAKYDREIGDLETYAQKEFGLLPAWMQKWPQPLQKRHTYLYGELMGNREDTLVDSELKHLMARVSAIAKGHDYLAAVEGYMAYHTADDKERVIERIKQCFIVATEKEDIDGISVFDVQERAALRVAWLSAQVPLTTPYRFVQSAVALYQPNELIHLIVVCSVASMVQRFVAIAQPSMETKVSKFYTQHSIETDVLKLRYPLPLKLEAVG